MFLCFSKFFLILIVGNFKLFLLSVMKRLLNNSYKRNVDSRINRIVALHKALPRPQVIHKTRCRSTSVITQNLNHMLNEQDARYIFKAKWDDLEIPQSKSAEQRFVDQFFHSIKKKSLNFGSYGLGPKAAKAFLEIISTQTHFYLLDLSSNKLGDEGAYYISQYLSCNPSIISLDLRSNNITSEGFVNIFKALKNNINICYLDISAIDGIDRNKLGVNGCQELSKLLMSNDILTNLNLSMSGIPIDSCSILSKALSVNKALVWLDVSGNRFGHSGLSKLFSEENSLGLLEYINLSKNDITDLASTSICRQLSMPNYIKTIDLSYNKLSNTFLKKLLTSIQSGQIQNLYLSHNLFDNESGEIIRSILFDVLSLQTLNLSSNPLRDESVRLISKGLKETPNRFLKCLDLSDTSIGNLGAVKLAKALLKNESLEKLLLNNNTISDEGGIALFKSLCQNKTLLFIGLQSNEMTDESAQSIYEVLLRNNTIRDINIDFNDFSYRRHVHLKEMILEHKKMMNSNITEYASRHIELLKEDEKKLFKVREKLEKQQKEVNKTLEEKNQKERFFQDLKSKKSKETIESDNKLLELKKEYEELHEKRLDFQSKYRDLRISIDAQQKNAESEYQKITAKRQHAAARLHRANTKKLEIEVESTRELDDLKMQLDMIKEQLSQIIIQAHKEQDEIIRIDEERNSDEEESRISKKSFKNIELESMGPNLNDEKRVMTSIEEKRKRINKKSNKSKKVKQRLNTASGAPIVRPQLQTDVFESI